MLFRFAQIHRITYTWTFGAARFTKAQTWMQLRRPLVDEGIELWSFNSMRDHFIARERNELEAFSLVVKMSMSHVGVPRVQFLPPEFSN